MSKCRSKGFALLWKSDVLKQKLLQVMAGRSSNTGRGCVSSRGLKKIKKKKKYSAATQRAHLERGSAQCCWTPGTPGPPAPSGAGQTAAGGWPGAGACGQRGSGVRGWRPRQRRGPSLAAAWSRAPTRTRGTSGPRSERHVRSRVKLTCEMLLNFSCCSYHDAERPEEAAQHGAKHPVPPHDPVLQARTQDWWKLHHETEIIWSSWRWLKGS